MQQAKLPLDADPLDDREKLLERFAGYRFVTLSDVLTIDLGQVLLAHEGRKNEPRDRVVRPGAFLQGGNQVDLKPRSITFAWGFGLRVCKMLLAGCLRAHAVCPQCSGPQSV